MGQANGKKKGKKQKIDYAHPPKIRRATTVIFKKGVTKMGDMRKVLDSGTVNIDLQTEVRFGFFFFFMFFFFVFGIFWYFFGVCCCACCYRCC